MVLCSWEPCGQDEGSQEVALYPGCCRHERRKNLQKMAARSTYKQPLKDYILEFTQVGEVGCPRASTTMSAYSHSRLCFAGSEALEY